MESCKLWTLRAVLVVGACYGVWAFVQLGLMLYLLGQVQFAFVDFATPLWTIALRYAGVAVLFGCVGHGLRVALGRRKRKAA